MLKIIGAIMICSGTASIGISAANKIAMRMRILRAWLTVMDTMSSEIKFLLTPLEELMVKCMMLTEEPMKTFFCKCIQQKRKNADVSFQDVWNKAFAECGFLELAEAERRIVYDLGNVLGKYSATEQVNQIEHLRGAMKARLTATEREKGGLGRLYSSLGIASGVALVIVFI